MTDYIFSLTPIHNVMIPEKFKGLRINMSNLLFLLDSHREIRYVFPMNFKNPVIWLLNAQNREDPVLLMRPLNIKHLILDWGFAGKGFFRVFSKIFLNYFYLCRWQMIVPPRATALKKWAYSISSSISLSGPYIFRYFIPILGYNYLIITK